MPTINQIELYHISMPLVHPFQTSFGRETQRDCIIVAVQADGLTGWGECTAHKRPNYSYETVQTAWHILADFLAPELIGHTIETTGDIFTSTGFQMVRGHHMAKAALENAVWDLLAKAQDISLSQMLGGVRQRVEVGVSIGIQPSLDALLERVAHFVEAGYQRVKMKIKPGWELTPLKAIRQTYPDLKLMADANSAFGLGDIALLQEMDVLNLLMIEQPLAYNDIFDHATLQAGLQTRLCLDESILTPHDARLSIHLDACRIINIKVGRVGGFTNALTIHNLCAVNGMPVWCGGMLETGIGRAANLHLASLPNFTLPGDISASSRYYADDIATPTFSLNPEDSTITLPQGPGLGIEVDLGQLQQFQIKQQIIT